MSGYCIQCGRVVEQIGGKCCVCGKQLGDARNANKFFLSGPCQGPTLTIHLESGQKLLENRYTVESLLGRGRFNTVYLAFDSTRSEKVALNVIPLVSEDMARQLSREVEACFTVTNYSHVIRLNDVHIIPYDGVVLLLVSTEYADGGSFRQWLLRNKDNICKRQTEGLYYFKQVCRGIQALHDSGILHGARPEDSLFVNGILKVSGLDFTRCMRNVQGEGRDHRLLGSDASLGAPEYLAPEQFMAAHPGDIDIRADIYSLGVVLFEICHPKCRLPFGGNPSELRQRHLQVPPPVLENVDANVARVVAKCLQKAPADRYARISELIDDLEAGSTPETPENPPTNMQQPSVEPVDELWQQACQFMDMHNLNEAGKLCDRILSISPEHSQARTMGDAIKSRFGQARQFYETIKNGIGSQSLERLSTLLAEAVEIYPDHPDGRLVQTQLLSITREYKNAMREGAQAVGEGCWDEAQRSFEKARELNPGFSSIARLVDFMSDVRRKVKSARGNIDAAIQRKNWRKAMSLASAVDQYVEGIKQMAIDY